MILSLAAKVELLGGAVTARQLVHGAVPWAWWHALGELEP